MRTTTVLAALAASAAVASAVASFTTPVELPPVPNPKCAWDVWPKVDLDGIDIGDYEWAVYERFGKRNNRRPLFDSLEPRRCIAFVYDENLLKDPPVALTVLIDGRRVRGRWLAKTPFAAQECRGLPQETVDVKHRFHAGACWG